MFLNEWFPVAYLFGITYDQFWKLTIREINAYAKAFELKQNNDMKFQNLMAYIQGLYFCDALNVVVGNMFARKGSNKAEYPKEPYNFFETEEEEQEKKRNMFVEQLKMAQLNFELSKKGE